MSYIFATKKHLTEFIKKEIVMTTEAAKILGCTRQNIDDLARRGKLSIIKQSGRTKLFYRDDVMDRMDITRRKRSKKPDLDF